MLYKHYRKLVGDRTANARLREVKVTKTQFADNIIQIHIIYITYDYTALYTTSFESNNSEVGLTVQRN